MIIPNIQTPKIYTQKPTQNQITYTRPIKMDSVNFQSTKIYQKALSKLNEITKKEYNSLTEIEKNILREKVNYLSKNITDEIDLHHFAAESIKQVFDKQYGEKNYVVVNIGRSLSSISKLLELKIGKEYVKSIPMSNMKSFCFYNYENKSSFDWSIEQFFKYKDMEKFKKFLNSIGLNKKTIENSNKNYILIDYTCSGKSLDTVYSLLTTNELLGNKKRNITIAPVINLISMSAKYEQESLYLDCLLNAGIFKNFSFADRTTHNFSNIFEANNYKEFIKNLEKMESQKLFGFALLDSEFSSKPIPYKDKLNFDRIPNRHFAQQRCIWNFPDEQFRIDIKEDLQEIYKILNTIERNIEKFNSNELKNALKYQTIMNKFHTTIAKKFITFHFDDTQYSYYTDFRADLLEKISEFNNTFEKYLTS